MRRLRGKLWSNGLEEKITVVRDVSEEIQPMLLVEANYLCDEKDGSIIFEG